VFTSFSYRFVFRSRACVILNFFNLENSNSCLIAGGTGPAAVKCLPCVVLGEIETALACLKDTQSDAVAQRAGLVNLLGAVRTQIEDNNKRLLAPQVRDILKRTSETMLVHRSVVDIQLSSCELIGLLAQHHPNERSRVTGTMLKFILNLLSQYRREMSMQRLGIEAIFWMILNTKIDSKVLGGASIMSVIEAMREYEEDSKIQQWGCAALSQLVRNKSLAKTIFPSIGGVSVILKALAMHADIQQVQQYGILAIGNMQYFQPLVDKSMISPTETSIVRMLAVLAVANTSSHDQTQAWVWFAIAAMCCKDFNRQNLIWLAGRDDVVPLLVAALERHCTNPSVVTWCCLVLSQLAALDESMQSRIASVGGIDAVLRVLTPIKLGANLATVPPTVRARAFTALAELSLENNANQTKIAACGGLEVIVAGLKRPSGRSPKACEYTVPVDEDDICCDLVDAACYACAEVSRNHAANQTVLKELGALDLLRDLRDFGIEDAVADTAVAAGLILDPHFDKESASGSSDASFSDDESHTSDSTSQHSNDSFGNPQSSSYLTCPDCNMEVYNGEPHPCKGFDPVAVARKKLDLTLRLVSRDLPSWMPVEVLFRVADEKMDMADPFAIKVPSVAELIEAATKKIENPESISLSDSVAQLKMLFAPPVRTAPVGVSFSLTMRGDALPVLPPDALVCDLQDVLSKKYHVRPAKQMWGIGIPERTIDTTDEMALLASIGITPTADIVLYNMSKYKVQPFAHQNSHGPDVVPQGTVRCFLSLFFMSIISERLVSQCRKIIIAGRYETGI
jgi:hypothetical protein